MFKQYRRKQIAELRPVTERDILTYKMERAVPITIGSSIHVSISDVDKINGSPKIGDMIARNPINNQDQWLVAEQYFIDNFEPIKD